MYLIIRQYQRVGRYNNMDLIEIRIRLRLFLLRACEAHTDLSVRLRFHLAHMRPPKKTLVYTLGLGHNQCIENYQIYPHLYIECENHTH